MNPLRIAAWAVQLVCDLFAPVQPERVLTGQHAPKLWPDGEQPLIEPDCMSQLHVSGGTYNSNASVEPMPGWFRGGFDDETSASSGSTSLAGVDPSVEEGPTAGRAHTLAVGHPTYTPTGTPLQKLLRASAHNLYAYAGHIACPAAVYVNSLADQLHDAANAIDPSSK